MNTKELLDVLVGLVQSVTEEPKRVLFRRGRRPLRTVPERAEADNLEWVVLKTAPGRCRRSAEQPGHPGSGGLLPRGSGRAESLNAFRVFNEADMASALVARAADGGAWSHLLARGPRPGPEHPPTRTTSAEDLANFLLRGEPDGGCPPVRRSLPRPRPAR